MTREEYDEIREALDAEKGKVYRPGEGVVLTAVDFRRATN